LLPIIAQKGSEEWQTNLHNKLTAVQSRKKTGIGFDEGPDGNNGMTGAVDTIRILSHQVGFVIGRGGEQIKAWEAQTGTKIQVSSHALPGTSEHEVQSCKHQLALTLKHTLTLTLTSR